eukprot:5603590-Amphidinium_carterae.1
MITDQLEVFEASPTKMLELLAEHVEGFKGLKTCIVQVTSEHLKQILLRGLLGSKKVLTETFSNTCIQQEWELGSAALSSATTANSGCKDSCASRPHQSCLWNGNA